MSAAIFNFTGKYILEQGAGKEVILYLVKDGIPWNLSGFEAKLQVKTDFSNTVSIITLTSDPDGGLTINGTDGSIKITWSVANILSLSSGKAYVFDLLIMDTGNTSVPIKIIKGIVEAESGVTRI